jgi:hypothetical protein
MALGASYVTLLELKDRLGDIGDEDDDVLQGALDAASRGIEKFTGRQFNDAGTVSARVYRPDTECRVDVDDFHTTTGLILETDEGDTGVFGSVWTASQYELYPLNGVVDGEPGWPYSKIRSVSSRFFPGGRRATVRVTARWGWAAVPAAVKESCLVAAVEIFKLKDAPFGVGGYTDFGIMRVRDNPFVARMLAPYQRHTVMVA